MWKRKLQLQSTARILHQRGLHNTWKFSCRTFTSSQITSSDSESQNRPPTEGWAWIPPRTMGHLESDATKKRFKLPVKVGKLIESQELKDFLEQNGGENVVILKLERPLVDIAEFVIATFPSTRLIRNAANAIKENLKDRELFHVMGAHEIEGKKDEEWQAVDCQTTLVHLFLPEIRGHIDLEGHWSSKERPVVSLSLDEVDFDRKMEELLDQYPTPKDYLKEKDAKSTFKGFDQEVKSL